MLSQKECLQNGLEVVKQCASWFYSTNASHYNTQGFDFEDLEGHLRAEVLIKYLGIVDRNPEYYGASKAAKGKDEMEAFRSSLYQSCRNACFAHHRKHIRSQKRGLNLRHGMIHLDHSELNSEGIVVSEGLLVEKKPDYSTIYKPVADTLYHNNNVTAARLWCLLWHENKPMTAVLLQEIGDDKDRLMSVIKKAVSEFLPEEAPNLTHSMDPSLKEKFRSITQKAINAGLVRVDEKPSDAVSRLLEKVASMDEAQAEALLGCLSNGNLHGSNLIEKTRAIKKEVLQESAKKWLVVDYEIVSDALGIEINPEMSPLVVRRLLDSSLSKLEDDKKMKLPDLVWEFVKSINEVFPDSTPKRIEVECLKDRTLFVRIPSPASFLVQMRQSQYWMSWIDSNDIRFWGEQQCICFESTNFSGLDSAFLQTVIDSFQL